MTAPISPKAHGAWLGSGTGVAISGVIVGLIQTYVTHRPLPQATADAVFLVVSAALAFAGAWLAPSTTPPAPRREDTQ